MNLHLKNAIQHLDCHIAEVTAARDRLVEVFGERPGNNPASVQTPERLPAVTAAEAVRLPDKVVTKRRAKRVQRKIGKIKIEVGTPKLSAMHPAMVQAGLKLNEPFTAVNLREMADCALKQAQNAITRWLTNGMIKRVNAGKYRRLAKFAKVAETDPVRAEEPAPVVQNQTAPEPPPQNIPPTPKENQSRLTPATTSEDKLTPLSASGIAIGRKLANVFTADQLATVLPNGKQQAYYFIAQCPSASLRPRCYSVLFRGGAVLSFCNPGSGALATSSMRANASAA